MVSGRAFMQLPNVVACIALGIFLALGSCSLMPADGPTSMDVRSGQADPEGLPYATIKLTPQVIDILATEAPSLSAAFADRRPPGNIRFGVGDVVSVTVFEAGAGGLFIPSEAGVRPGNFVNIPNRKSRLQRQYHHALCSADSCCGANSAPGTKVDS